MKSGVWFCSGAWFSLAAHVALHHGDYGCCVNLHGDSFLTSILIYMAPVLTSILIYVAPVSTSMFICVVSVSTWLFIGVVTWYGFNLSVFSMKHGVLFWLFFRLCICWYQVMCTSTAPTAYIWACHSPFSWWPVITLLWPSTPTATHQMCYL